MKEYTEDKVIGYIYVQGVGYMIKCTPHRLRI